MSKKMSKIISIVVMFSMMLSMAVQYVPYIAVDALGESDNSVISQANPSYNGFIADPTQDEIPTDAIPISTPEELAGIGGAESEGKYYYLTKDITLVTEWMPIDDFRGAFDGRGYTINNLYILETSKRQYAGLFGNISTSTAIIKNIGINIGTEGINAIAGSAYAGGLLGRSSDSCKITNCYVIGDVNGYSLNISSAPYSYAGGLVGYNLCSISNSYAIGNVWAETSSRTMSYYYHYSYAGGLIGYNASPYEISSCYAKSRVTASSFSDLYATEMLQLKLTPQIGDKIR